MKIHKQLLLLAGAGLLLGSTALMGAEKTAKSILDNAYRYIGSMDRYAFNAVVSDTDPKDGKSYKHNISVKVDRPDKLRVDTKGDIRDRSVYINDGLFTLMDHKFNYYGQLKVPKSIDGALDYIFERYGITAPLASLIYSDMGKRAKFSKGKYFGTVDVAGVMCDYVAFRNKAGEVHIWIATGDKPLVKAYSIIDTHVEGKPRKNTSIKWTLDPKFPQSDFVFIAPKGASKISIEPAS